MVGLGELNIGGGGIGPISETGIGGSGNSDNVKVLTVWCLSGGGVPFPVRFWKAILGGASKRKTTKKKI